VVLESVTFNTQFAFQPRSEFDQSKAAKDAQKTFTKVARRFRSVDPDHEVDSVFFFEQLGIDGNGQADSVGKELWESLPQHLADLKYVLDEELASPRSVEDAWNSDLTDAELGDKLQIKYKEVVSKLTVSVNNFRASGQGEDISTGSDTGSGVDSDDSDAGDGSDLDFDVGAGEEDAFELINGRTVKHPFKVRSAELTGFFQAPFVRYAYEALLAGGILFNSTGLLDSELAHDSSRGSNTAGSDGRPDKTAGAGIVEALHAIGNNFSSSMQNSTALNPQDSKNESKKRKALAEEACHKAKQAKNQLTDHKELREKELWADLIDAFKLFTAEKGALLKEMYEEQLDQITKKLFEDDPAKLEYWQAKIKKGDDAREA
jgi:hypothetical protein